MSHILEGKTITSIDVADDKISIRFNTDQGEVVAICDAECCSDTWIEHLELPARGFPCLVISADILSMPDLGDMPNRDYVSYYGFKIVTDKGEIIIDYRNESNGYYGGDLLWPDDEDDFYGGVYGQNVSSHNWVSVTEDF